jgi:hypothetical protein
MLLHNFVMEELCALLANTGTIDENKAERFSISVRIVAKPV